MVLADFSDYVGPAFLVWLVLMLVAIVAGWFKREFKHLATADKQQLTEVTDHLAHVKNQLAEAKDQLAEAGRQLAEARIQVCQAAMRDFGVIMRTGDELRMGWYEHTFVMERPVAGVAEVWTLHGSAFFTVANRCIVISDGQRLVILDREKDHGVRLEITQTQWFEASVHESSVVVSCYERHGGSELAQRFVIEAHTDHNGTLVPEGWPWKSTLFPESAVSSHENSSN